jgi:hypothetical protein
MSVEIVTDGFSKVNRVDPQISEALQKTKELGGEAAGRIRALTPEEADKKENQVRATAQALGIGARVRKVTQSDGSILVVFQGKDKRAKAPNGTAARKPASK